MTAHFQRSDYYGGQELVKNIRAIWGAYRCCRRRSPERRGFWRGSYRWASVDLRNHPGWILACDLCIRAQSTSIPRRRHYFDFLFFLECTDSNSGIEIPCWESVRVCTESPDGTSIYDGFFHCANTGCIQVVYPGNALFSDTWSLIHVCD